MWSGSMRCSLCVAYSFSVSQNLLVVSWSAGCWLSGWFSFIPRGSMTSQTMRLRGRGLRSPMISHSLLLNTKTWFARGKRAFRHQFHASREIFLRAFRASFCGTMMTVLVPCSILLERAPSRFSGSLSSMMTALNSVPIQPSRMWSGASPAGRLLIRTRAIKGAGVFLLGLAKRHLPF